MVATALLTVRRPRQRAQQIDILAMLARADARQRLYPVGLLLDDDARTPDSSPPPLYYFILGAIAMQSAVKDIRMIEVRGSVSAGAGQKRSR